MQKFLSMTIKPNFDEIPQIMRDTARWLCWQLQPADPKPKKIPMSPKNGKLQNAAVNDPTKWLPFDTALDFYLREECTGIGFALTKAAPQICCIDVDHCFDDEGNLSAEARAVLSTCDNSWAEKSQSGTGIHIWLIDSQFEGGRRGGNVEVYADNRYIAVTGNTINDADIKTVNGACKAVIASFIDKAHSGLINVAELPIGISDLADFITTVEVAEILGVATSSVKNWRQRKLFGCYFFPADEKRGNTWYYNRDRVNQLKSVYQFGILQNMYKLARRNPDITPPFDFQKRDSSRTQGEELNFRYREFFTVGEVADYFGVAISTVKSWHQRGQLKEDMLGHNGDLYFGIDNVIEFTPPAETDCTATQSPSIELPALSAQVDSSLNDTEIGRIVYYLRSEKCKDRDPNAYDLFNGNIDSYFARAGKSADDSAADAALMQKLLYYAGVKVSDDTKLPATVIKIFNKSALAKRGKWQDRADYRERTFRAAFKFWVEGGRKTAVKAGDTTESLQADLREAEKEIAAFDKEKETALEKLRGTEKFDFKTVNDAEFIKASAFARVFDKSQFSVVCAEIKRYSDKHKVDKTNLNDWRGTVKEAAQKTAQRDSELKTRRADIQARIKNLDFIARNDKLRDFEVPAGYCVTAAGVEKVTGEKLILICSRPIIADAQIFNVETGTYSLRLAMRTSKRKWKALPPIEQATLFNARTIISLANQDFPVTSSNAALIVDYLSEFKAQNESKLAREMQYSRCGWQEVNGRDFFIDPRRDNNFIISDDDRKITLAVSLKSQFSRALKTAGSLSKWRGAYDTGKKSPFARFMVAASLAAPLLKVLGERNFLIHVYTDSLAGKTTALLLGASAVGSEKMIRSFDATKNGLIGAMADVTDYSFLVDEKQVADQKIKAQLASFVYSAGNAIGRLKLNKDSTVREPQDWRTIVIATGETPLLDDNVAQGAHSRLLQIAAPKTILKRADCKAIRDIISDNYGHAFPLLIDEIIKRDKEELRGIYDDLVDAFSEKNHDVLNEYCRYMAVVTLSDFLLNCALDVDENSAYNEAVLSATEIFPKIPTRREIEDTPREIEFVESFIAENQNSFIGGGDNDGNNDNDSRNNRRSKPIKVFGKISGVDVYIIRSALKAACTSAGFDYRKVVKDLVAVGYFMPSDDCNTHVVWLEKASARCFYHKRLKM